MRDSFQIGFRPWLVFAWLLASLLRPAAAEAHVGAPYPVLLEESVGPYSVSALADPDVGTGTFYVLVTQAGDALAPEGTTVTLWVWPEDGHLPQAAHQAERQDTRYGERFLVKVPFDAKGPWQIRLAIEGPAGQGETAFPVEVTPAGLGWIATLACLLPFFIAGGLWLRGARRRPEPTNTDSP